MPAGWLRLSRSPLTFYPPFIFHSFFFIAPLLSDLHTHTSIIPFPASLWADKSSAEWQKLQWLIYHPDHLSKGERHREKQREREKEGAQMEINRVREEKSNE